MKTIAAISAEIDKPLLVDEIDLPDPAADDVAVKLLSSGICRSQLHEISTQRPRPRLLGHEGTGIVTRTGCAIKHLREGDHAIITWVSRSQGLLSRKLSDSIQTTYKGRPIAFSNVHTWSEHAVVPGDHVIPISKQDPTDVSCVVGCAVASGAGAVLHTAGVRPGDSVAVFGIGGVGLSSVRMASLLHAYPIIAVDLLDAKLEFAKQFGATHTINSSMVDPVATVFEISNGGVDYAFDTIGVRLTNEQILRVTRGGGAGAYNHGGLAVLVGVPGPEVTLDLGLVLSGQRQYRGSLGAAIPDRDFRMYLRWHHEGKFRLDSLVTSRYRLDQINQACDALRAGEVLGRAIIEY